jgi:hypothetical protein
MLRAIWTVSAIGAVYVMKEHAAAGRAVSRGVNIGLCAMDKLLARFCLVAQVRSYVCG